MLENVEELINCAYENSCKHGFHDEETSYDEQMMLVITEVSEMVEADRRGYYSFSNVRHPKMVEFEEWRPIDGTNEYEVSSFGRVRSKDMQVWNGHGYYTKKGQILRAGRTKSGYMTVALRGIGTKKVSILVANAFLEKKNKNDVVNHIDGNKENNNLGNLEFVSPSENNLHALKTGLRSTKSYSKLSYADRVYIAFQRKNGRKYTSIFKDKDWGVTKSAIQHVCNEYKKYTESVEFEFADICIRLFDICGAFDIKPFIDCDDEMKDEWLSDFGEKSLREVAFCFTQIASKDMSFINEDGYSVHLGSLLVFLAIWAEHLGIDIDRHIALKMRYNAGRVYKHGKKY